MELNIQTSHSKDPCTINYMVLNIFAMGGWMTESALFVKKKFGPKKPKYSKPEAY